MRLDDDLQDAAATAGATVTCAAQPRVVDVSASRTARPLALRVTASTVVVILSLAACRSSGGNTSSQSTTESADDGTTADEVDDDATIGEDSDAGESTAEGDGDTDGCPDWACFPDIPVTPQCDPTLQDCPEGEKCAPVILDPISGNWDANVCVPAGDQPIGAPCSFVKDGVNGQDTCAEPGWCWSPDPNTGIGQCIEQCTYTSGAGYSCPISGEPCTRGTASGILNLCLPSCDPLVTPNPCWEGALCIPDPQGERAPERFICAPPAVLMAGAPGQACACSYCCQSGAICTSAAVLGSNCPEPDSNNDACCTALCDINSADGDDQCTATGLNGLQCVAMYPPGTPEPLGKLGKCVLPP